MEMRDEGVTPRSVSLAHQIIPRTSQDAFDSPGCCNEDVDLPGFDPLDVPNVQVHLFGQFFFGQSPVATLPAMTSTPAPAGWQR